MYTNKIEHLSRREFLKLGSLGLLGSFLSTISQEENTATPSFGRVMDEFTDLYDRPSFSGNAIKTYPFNYVLPIKGIEIGDIYPIYNQAWFKIKEKGYIHTSKLQPVEIKFNDPIDEIPEYGIISEVTVPFTDAYVSPSYSSNVAYRYYYRSTHWIGKIVTDIFGNGWYRIMDDQVKDQFYYVRTNHLRIIPKEELTLLSSNVPLSEKIIEVRGTEQLMIAYESGQPVFITQVSTGDEAANSRWKTPIGDFLTFYKRPSRHMAAGNRAFGDYDLPGVPWVSYITKWGIAFHGTYWHNDFGNPRSHGCINMTPDAAKWLYRWTQPFVPYDYQLKYRQGYGTRTQVVV